jgi:hypothetical protein
MVDVMAGHPKIIDWFMPLMRHSSNYILKQQKSIPGCYTLKLKGLHVCGFELSLYLATAIKNMYNLQIVMNWMGEFSKIKGRSRLHTLQHPEDFHATAN